MGRFDGILLCSDYDGTLAGPDGKVSPENAQAIRYFTENGGLFTLATGRSPDFVRQMCAVLPLNAPVMCLNGGAIVDPESFRVLEICPLPQSATAILPQLAHPEATYQVDLWYGDCQIIRWRLDSGRPLAGAFDAVPSPLFKAVLINSQREAAERMRDTAKETYAGLYRFERSWPEGLEILHESAMGRLRTLILRGKSDELQQKLAATQPLFLDVLPLTLEEIFIYELGGAGHALSDMVL